MFFYMHVVKGRATISVYACQQFNALQGSLEGKRAQSILLVKQTETDTQHIVDEGLIYTSLVLSVGSQSSNILLITMADQFVLSICLSDNG